MDKVRAAFRFLVKYHFWFLTIAIVLAAPRGGHERARTAVLSGAGHSYAAPRTAG